MPAGGAGDGRIGDQLGWLRGLGGAAPPAHERKDHQRDGRHEHGDEHVIELRNEGGQAERAEQDCKHRRYATQQRQRRARRAHPDELAILVQWSVRPRGCLGSLEGGEDRACLHRPCFVDAAGDEAIERFAHRAHRADLAFELPLLLDRAFADVPAAGGIATAQDEEIADLCEGEAAVLGLFDEAQAPGGILVVEPVPGRALAGRLDQTLALVIAQRVAPDTRGGSELADGEHGRPPRSACTLEVRPRSSLGKRVPHARGYAGRPSPAARRVALSTPRPAQHAASLPSMTTAGTERMPSPLARFATSTSRMSWTIT